MPMKIASSGSADLLTRTGRAFFLLAFGLMILTPWKALKNTWAKGPKQTSVRPVAMLRLR